MSGTNQAKFLKFLDQVAENAPTVFQNSSHQKLMELYLAEMSGDSKSMRVPRTPRRSSQTCCACYKTVKCSSRTWRKCICLPPGLCSTTAESRARAAPGATPSYSPVIQGTSLLPIIKNQPLPGQMAQKQGQNLNLRHQLYLIQTFLLNLATY